MMTTTGPETTAGPDPFCGDGVVSLYERVETLASPVVTTPGGATGRVCDDGALCPGRSYLFCFFELATASR